MKENVLYAESLSDCHFQTAIFAFHLFASFSLTAILFNYNF